MSIDLEYWRRNNYGGERGVQCVDVVCLVQLSDSLVPGEESCAPRPDGEFSFEQQGQENYGVGSERPI